MLSQQWQEVVVMSLSVKRSSLFTGIVALGIILIVLPGCFGGGGGTQTTYTVSGRVTQAGNPQQGIPDVTLAFSGGYGTATTNSNGNWSKSGLKGTVTVTPTKNGWTFQPPSRQVTGTASNVDFAGTPPALQRTLTVQISGQGSVAKNPDQPTYSEGTTVQLTANPDVGWAFSHWEGDLTGSSNPQTIVMNNNKSVTAVFAELSEGVPGAPNPPTGLKAVAVGGIDGVHIDLSWNPNQEADLRGYKIWLRNSDDTYSPLDIVGKETTSWRHSWLVLGQTYTYALSAYDNQNLESLRCDPVSCQAGNTLAPAQPQWDPIDPITTGVSGPGDYTCWVRLDWEPVTTNADGTPITDLAWYYIYRVLGEDPMLVGSVDSGTTEYTARDLPRGLMVTYVIKAVDKWGNQSVPSIQKSITTGGLAPAAPELVSLEALTDDTNRVRVVFQRVTTNSDGTPCNDIASYTIYRGLSQDILAPIATVQAQDPQPEEYEFIDSGVQAGRTYYYAVTVTDTEYNESAKSNILSVTAGDFEAPDAPTWVSLSTRVNADGTVDNILEWSHGNEDDLRGVYVYAATAPGDFELIAFVPKATTTYTHVDLINGQRYFYLLESFDKSGNRAKSAVRDIVAGSDIAPAAPVVSGEGIFDAETRTAGVRLTWPGVTQNTDGTPVTLLAGYRVYRAIVAAGEYSLIHTIECSDPGLAQSYDDWGLVNGNNYYYKVAAYNKLGNQGPYSGVVDVLAGD